jgi:hypothetical protein
MVGALFGNPFPTCIMIGQPAFKKMGGRVFYLFLNATMVVIVTWFTLVRTMRKRRKILYYIEKFMLSI